MEDAIANSVKKLNINAVREHQKHVIISYMEGKDVLFCSPTGSGKSLTFEIAPLLYKYTEKTTKATVIVVSPLVALMKKQTEKLVNLNVKAVYLRDIQEHLPNDTIDDEEELSIGVQRMTIHNLREGEADIIFTSPETILGNNRDLISILEKRKYLKAIFIDEAHCISKFGMSADKGKSPFRPAYGQLGELRSLTTVPVIALTATASKTTQELILNKMCMSNVEKVIVSPNKTNIKYWMVNTKFSTTCEDFAWLSKLLNDMGTDTPRMIIFFQRTRQIGDLYEYLTSSLGNKAYFNFKPDGPNDDRNRLFDMFHSKTDEEVKESICQSYMDPTGYKRVVLVSTSFSMGLDVKGVNHVIHYGPANDMEDYLQETGRCGRDGHQAHAILMKYKRCLSGRRSVQSSMRQYCKENTCRRTRLLQNFEENASHILPLHMCCDVCALLCKCVCKCPSVCTCEHPCVHMPSDVVDCIVDYKSNDSGSDDSGSQQRGETSSESEDERHQIKKNIVLQYSSDSD